MTNIMDEKLENVHVVLGVELADGVMTDLSWQRARVAVIADPPQADAATLAAAGWHVVGMGQ